MILVTGGARSGKSTYAETLARQWGEKVLYIATAVPCDAEMDDRIKRHQLRRPAHWDTFEGYRDLKQVFAGPAQNADVILLDCVTVQLSNLLWDELGEDVEGATPDQLSAVEQKLTAEVADFLDAAKQHPVSVIMVTNEIGFGIVPDNKLARIFRDLAGRVNQYLAARADAVYLLVCGLPLQLK